MKSIGLFAGIGGIEYGFLKQGVSTSLLCEIMPEAQVILKEFFKDADIYSDVRELKVLPNADILCAGFPCQNISIAGNKKGMSGEQSSLVTEIFRLVRTNKPVHIVIENVANIISLHKGEILSYITNTLHEMGYNWAYRLIDPRSFGIPQRRPRFVMVASLAFRPKDVLFSQSEDTNLMIEEKPTDEIISKNEIKAYGFYWTEGKIGIGWANNSIPPLKCGSSIGLPSAPAIWDIENNFFGCPSITDAERLQGFPINWTNPIEIGGYKKSLRWKVIGNAVNVRVSTWIADKIVNYDSQSSISLPYVEKSGAKWATAAFQDANSKIFNVECSPFPMGINYKPILDFLEHPLVPLSQRATCGFLRRVRQSTLIKYPQTFIDSLNIYLKNQYGYSE